MAKGELSRAEMEKAIKEGGSVLHGGKVISRMQDLPSEAKLAEGNEAEEDKLLSGYQAQIDQLKGKTQEILDGRAKRAATQNAPQQAQPEAQPAPQSEPAPQAQETQDDTGDERHGRRKR